MFAAQCPAEYDPLPELAARLGRGRTMCFGISPVAARRTLNPRLRPEFVQARLHLVAQTFELGRYASCSSPKRTRGVGRRSAHTPSFARSRSPMLPRSTIGRTSFQLGAREPWR